MKNFAFYLITDENNILSIASNLWPEYKRKGYTILEKVHSEEQADVLKEMYEFEASDKADNYISEMW